MTDEQKVKVYNNLVDEIEHCETLMYVFDARYQFVRGYLKACLETLEMTMQDLWDIEYEVMTNKYN